MAGGDEMVEIAIRLKDARRFMADARGSSRAVDDIGDSANRAGRNVGEAGRSSRMAAVGFGALTSAVKLGAVALASVAAVSGTYAVNAASNLTEQVNKSGVVFGKHAKGVQSWSAQLADSFGISQREALEASGVFGNMLVPMGFMRGEAANMSKGLVELAGDMASFNNADPSEVMEAMRAGLSGEAEPLRKYGVFLNDAVIQQEAMAKGMKMVGGNLSASQKAQAAYNVIVRQTNDAHGDFGRSAGTSLANQLRILKATTENVAASIGAKLLPMVLGIVKKITMMMGSFQRARKLGASFGYSIATALDDASGGGTKFSDMFFRIQDVVQRVMGKVRGALAIAVPALRKFGEGIVKGIAPAMPFLSNVLLPLLKGVAMGVIGALVGAWKIVWPVLKLLFRGLGMIGTAAAPFRSVIEKIGLVIGFVFAGPILKGIGLLGKMGGALGVVGGVAGFLGRVIIGVGAVIGRVAGFIFGAWLKLAGWWFGTLHGIGAAAVKLGGNLRGAISGAITAVLGVLSKAGAKFMAAGKSIWGKLVEGLKGALGSGMGFVKDMAGSFANAVIGMLNTAIPDTIPVPGAPNIDLPNNPIPTFAGGGTLRAGTGIVGEHRAEAITVLPGGGVRVDPLPPRLATRVRHAVPDPFDPFEAAGAGGGGTLTVEVPVYLDGQLMHRAVARDVNRKAARK